jgi:hypothetical protein
LEARPCNWRKASIRRSVRSKLESCNFVPLNEKTKGFYALLCHAGAIDCKPILWPADYHSSVGAMASQAQVLATWQL